MTNLSFMKKFLVTILAISFTQTMILGEINNKEYQELIVQCNAIRLRILQENDFNIIRQNALQSFEQNVHAITERFTSLGGARDRTALSSSGFGRLVGSAGSQLQSQLNALQVEHNLRLNIIIANTIAAFLTTINTETSRFLLAQLIANGFKF